MLDRRAQCLEATLEAEQPLSELALAHGIELIILRPFLIHGPGAKGDLAALCQAIARGLAPRGGGRI